MAEWVACQLGSYTHFERSVGAVESGQSGNVGGRLLRSVPQRDSRCCDRGLWPGHRLSVHHLRRLQRVTSSICRMHVATEEGLGVVLGEVCGMRHVVPVRRCEACI